MKTQEKNMTLCCYQILIWSKCWNIRKLGYQNFKNVLVKSGGTLWNIFKKEKSSSNPSPLRWEGGPGHFCIFGSYESTFYCWTAAFYGTKISRRVKKLLTFEGQSSDNFPIEIYRGNLVKIWSFWSIFFCILTIDAKKLV